ncbi:hypothetical protein BSP109_03355 [Brevibacterium sp. Mu109]|nr:hypothetical protein BSP109_03355 [Brevibacterium sp. Mu109]
MAIMVAVPDNASADAAVTAAIGEARHFDTNLVVVPRSPSSSNSRNATTSRASSSA